MIRLSVFHSEGLDFVLVRDLIDIRGRPLVLEQARFGNEVILRKPDPRPVTDIMIISKFFKVQKDKKNHFIHTCSKAKLDLKWLKNEYHDSTITLVKLKMIHLVEKLNNCIDLQ